MQIFYSAKGGRDEGSEKRSIGDKKKDPSDRLFFAGSRAATKVIER